jgi:hypothetical protein
LKGAILAAAILIIVVLVAEGIFVTNFISRTETLQRSAREVEVITAVNVVELTKNSLHQATDYSVYQASYDIGRLGGYYPTFPKQLPVEESTCIPFYRIYDNSWTPTVRQSMQNRTFEVFTQYVTQLEGPVQLPDYIKERTRFGTFKKFYCQQNGLSDTLDPSKVVNFESCGNEQFCDRVCASAGFEEGDIIRTDVSVSYCDCVKTGGNTIKFYTTGKIEYEDDLTKIEDEGNVVDTIDTTVNELYKSAVASFVTSDQVAQAIQKAEDSLEDRCKFTDDPTCQSKPDNCINDFVQRVNENLENLKGLKGAVVVNFEKLEQKEDTYLWNDTRRCYREYLAAVWLKFTVKTDRKYPVYDGASTDYKEIPTNFHVVSGNEYARQLVRPQFSLTACPRDS